MLEIILDTFLLQLVTGLTRAVPSRSFLLGKKTAQFFLSHWYKWLHTARVKLLTIKTTATVADVFIHAPLYYHLRCDS